MTTVNDQELEAKLQQANQDVKQLKQEIQDVCVGKEIGTVFSGLLSMMVDAINDDRIPVEIRQAMVNAWESAYYNDLNAEDAEEIEGEHVEAAEQDPSLH